MRKVLADAPQRSSCSNVIAPKMGASYIPAMRIIARCNPREAMAALAGHQDQQAVKAALDAWFDEVKQARWRNTADVKRS
jgi:hypothetical protein